MTIKVRPSPDDLQRASSDVFSGLDPATIDALAAAMERVELSEEAVLVRQGDPADALFVVLEGRSASAVGADDSPAEQALGTMGPGDVIGEVAVAPGLGPNGVRLQRRTMRPPSPDGARPGVDHPAESRVEK